MEAQSRLDILIPLYLQGRLSAEEYRELWMLLEKHPDELPLDAALEDLWARSRSYSSNISDEEWDAKMQLAMSRDTAVIQAEKVMQPAGHRIRFRRMLAAAIMIGILISTVFYLKLDKEDVRSDIVQKENAREVLPGGNKAILTLSDGSVIDLGHAGNGKLAEQGNTQILKKEDGRLNYQDAGRNPASMTFNTLRTPRGGQYQITLSDGSKVWLNAASSMRYPVSFSNHERRVEITGEAYFDIAKDPSRPFNVKINDMEVQVLGTRFNINGYDDEASIRTTLLEGKIKISTPAEEKNISPGQQVAFRSGRKLMISSDVNLEETVAWKDGHFQFENSDIQSVMRQLSRWYDMDVSYEGEVKKHFIGGISRQVNLSKVLSMLEQTGEVSFQVDGQTIIVKP
jgi:ferric-dicitrate binding protein FerR (iron transport regulator)